MIAAWRAHFLGAERALAVLVAAGVAVWSERFDGSGELDRLLDDQANVLYATAAGVQGALLGFVLTANAVLIGLADQNRLGLVARSRHYGTLWDTFLAAMWVLGAGSITSLVGLLVPGDDVTQRVIFYLWVLTALLAIVRVARCIWVVGLLVRVVTARSAAASRHDTAAPPPATGA